MLYLLYILIGIIIVLGVNCLITAYWAVMDTLKYQDRDHLTFIQAFNKYFAKNNNIPTSMSDLFN